MNDESFLPNILGSASASIIGRICTHPLDTAKARLQAIYHADGFKSSNHQHNPRRYHGTWDVLARTFRSEGITGLYRGFGAVMVGGTPGTMIYLCSYEIAKDRLSHYVSTDNEFVIHFSAGMIAETLACIIYVPVDVVKERMQIQHKDQHSQHGMGYRNSWDALRKIAATEGTAGVYKGYAATLGSFGPFSALYFMLYEQFKYWTRLRLTDRKESSMRQLDGIDIPFPWLIACSSTAGALASWITSPLDMAKLRLQVQRGQAWGQQPSSSAAVTTYTGVFDCLKKAMATDGLPSLFRGAGARVIFTVPITTVTMTSYETCRSFISKILPNHSHN